jgi:hypothetical protein
MRPKAKTIGVISFVSILLMQVPLFSISANATEAPNLKFTKIIHSPELLPLLESDRLGFLAFPSFMASPGNQVLDIASDFSSVNLHNNQQGFAPLIRIGSSFVTIGGPCSNAFFGTSSCDSLVFFSIKGQERKVVKLNDASGLDQHDLIATKGDSFWGVRYSIHDCKQNPGFCGGKNQPKVVTHFADCEIINFKNSGEIVTLWSAAKNLPVTEILWDYWKDDIYQSNFADPFHCNSIDFNRTSSKLLVSMRHTNSIYALNLEEKTVEWKIGGNYLHGVSLSRNLTEDEIEIAGQHDARWISPNSISLFDNGSNAGRPARGLIISIKDRHYRTLGIFQDPTFSKSQCTGSFRRFNLSGTAYFVAGWGCSKNGATVFTSRGKPIVSIMIDPLRSSKYFQFDSGPLTVLNTALSYRIYPYLK